MPGLITCLWFDGQAQQAAELYTSLFPNSAVGDIARFGPDMPGPEGEAMTVEFTLDGRPFMGLNGGPEFPFTEATSVQIICADQAEVDHYWDGLLAGGGRESQCGWLKDRFGFNWQVVPQVLLDLQKTDHAAAVNQAMLKMIKLDIAELEAAAGAA